MECIKDILVKELEDNNETKLFNDIEMPLTEVLSDMELTGIKVDRGYLENLEKAMELAKAKSFIRIAGYGTENTGHFAKAALEPDSMPGFYLLPGEHIQ